MLTFPLHQAVLRGDVELVNELLTRGRADTDAWDSNGDTALQLALDRRDAAMIAALAGHSADQAAVAEAGAAVSESDELRRVVQAAAVVSI